ncbi:MAG TPA: hypothetical protein VMH50_16775 [Thermoleophilia bacterium]|nr:hypothetical protein [Thermoleophilia bacterium]
MSTVVGDLILGGVLPGIGAAFMAFVTIYSLATKPLTFTNLVFGFGLSARQPRALVRGAQAVNKPSFYSDPSTSYGDKVDAELDAPAPPSEGPGL